MSYVGVNGIPGIWSDEWQIHAIVRRRRSNPGGHTDRLVMFACSSDANEGQSS